MLIKDYNASVANKEGLPLATEGANVSYFILQTFASKSHLGKAVWLLS